jgi:hypothetical protein
MRKQKTYEIEHLNKGKTEKTLIKADSAGEAQTRLKNMYWETIIQKIRLAGRVGK